MTTTPTTYTPYFTTLFTWADDSNIPEAIFPRSKELLLSLTELKLHDMNLSTLPAGIGLLVNLKVLHLHGNQLVSLPKEIGDLCNLEKLWVQFNALTALPDELLKLTKLVELAALNNQLTELPEGLVTMPKLEWLFVQHNFLDLNQPMFTSVPESMNIATYGQKKFVNNKQFYIEGLHAYYLPHARVLRDQIFKDITQEEKPSLDASLDIVSYREWYKKSGIDKLDYWVLIDRASEKVIGLTGLYTEIDDDENTCWLGWFCVDPTYRKSGLGRALLDFSIVKAKNMKKQQLKLYTYDAKEYNDAIAMYEQYGFKVFKPIGRVLQKKDIFMKLDL